MAIEIRIESSWDTDDGEGRTIEVTLVERRDPGQDPIEDSHWFAGGDTERLKGFLCELIDEKAQSFRGRERRECVHCGRVFDAKAATGPYCALCRP